MASRCSQTREVHLRSPEQVLRLAPVTLSWGDWAPYGAGAPVPPRGSHGSPGGAGLACGLICGFAALAFLSHALQGIARCARSPLLCHTGESRCPLGQWVPAFAGTTRGGDGTDAKRAEAGQHGRVSYGRGGAGDSGRAGDWWPKRLGKIAGKLVFRAPLWITFLARQKGHSAAGPRPGAASPEKNFSKPERLPAQ